MPYSPFYDPVLFEKKEGLFNNTLKTYNQEILARAHTINFAIDLLKKKDYLGAVKLLMPAVNFAPRAGDGIFFLTVALVKLNEFQQAENVLEKYFEFVDEKTFALEPFNSQIQSIKAYLTQLKTGK
jgi:hypothetical protein